MEGELSRSKQEKELAGEMWLKCFPSLNYHSNTSKTCLSFKASPKLKWLKFGSWLCRKGPGLECLVPGLGGGGKTFKSWSRVRGKRVPADLLLKGTLEPQPLGCLHLHLVHHELSSYSVTQSHRVVLKPQLKTKPFSFIRRPAAGIESRPTWELSRMKMGKTRERLRKPLMLLSG